MTRRATCTRYLSCLVVAWFVQIFSNNQQVHSGVYATLERCNIARANLMRSFAELGYPNLRGFCVHYNEYGR